MRRSSHPYLVRALVRVCACAVVGALAACEPEPDAADADAGPDAPSPCAAPALGGLPLDTLEAAPGYDEALAALALDDLPATLPLDGLSDLERGLVLYMLEQRALDVVDRDAARAHGPLGDAVLGAFAAAAPGEDLDFAFLRRGLFRFYACDRAFPPTLDDFKRDVVDFTAEAPDEVVDSDVKGLARRITRSAPAGAFIAETLRADGTVRETEIILTDRRADLTLDFLEYDERGQLRAASEFAAAGGGESIGAVPFSCIACHGFTNVDPAP